MKTTVTKNLHATTTNQTQSRGANLRSSLVVTILVSFGLALSLGACTKKSADKPITDAAPAIAPSEPGNDVSDAPPSAVPKIDGLDVTGEKFEPLGEAFVVDELKIADASGKVLDQFPILDWGPVKIMVDGQILRVFPNGDIFEVVYKVDAAKKVTRSTSCKFDRPPESAYRSAVAATQKPNTNWENFYQVTMADLAGAGNKSAYNFFVSPNTEAKELRSHVKNAQSFEPIVRVLKYMKANGCSW